MKIPQREPNEVGKVELEFGQKRIEANNIELKFE
jgi:hypothetical protein